MCFLDGFPGAIDSVQGARYPEDAVPRDAPNAA